MAKFSASNPEYHSIFLDNKYNVDDLLEYVALNYTSSKECTHATLMKLILDYFETNMKQDEEIVETEMKQKQEKSKTKVKPDYYQLTLFDDGSTLC